MNFFKERVLPLKKRNIIKPLITLSRISELLWFLK